MLERKTAEHILQKEKKKKKGAAGRENTMGGKQRKTLSRSGALCLKARRKEVWHNLLIYRRNSTPKVLAESCGRKNSGGWEGKRKKKKNASKTCRDRRQDVFQTPRF